MFQPLAKITGYLFGFLIATVLVVFTTAYLIIDSQPTVTSQAQILKEPPAPPVELTEVQKEGKTIFNANCASCHKLYKKAVGPALAGVADKYERDWLYSWIKNSAALIASGDAQAVAVYNEYGQANMNAFPQLSNEDIDKILEYTSIPKP